MGDNVFEGCDFSVDTLAANMNDPWVPGLLAPPISDPKFQLISSERYLTSLESKLSRIQGKTKQEPSAKDLIRSLERVKDDHMTRYIADNNRSNNEYHRSDFNSDDQSAMAYFDRLLHPERQPISGEELMELLQDDSVAISWNQCKDDSLAQTSLVAENCKLNNIDRS